MIDVHKKNGFRSAARAPAAASVSPLRQAVQGKPQGPLIQLSRPISLPVLCTTDLPGEPSGHHDLFARDAEEAVSHVLIHEARQLFSEEPLGLTLANTVYALDSTTINLCLSLFP